MVAGAQLASSGVGAMVMPQLLVVAVAEPPGVESVTFTVKENGPAVVGVPLITPVVGSASDPRAATR